MEEELDKQESEASDTNEESGRSVSSDLIRGHINTIILRALYEGDKYGYEIIADIENKSHGQYSLKQPSLYSALKRLEKDGCITSYWGGSVSGGRRKYFSLTDLGKEISEKNQSEWEYSRTIIDSLISDKDFDFSNPAPNNVDMRLLRDTTSRVPREAQDDEEESITRFGSDLQSPALLAREQALNEEKAALERKIEEMRKEQEWRERELSIREENLKAEREKLSSELSSSEETEEHLRTIEEKENEIQLLRHVNETLKRELQEQEEKAEDLKLRIIEEERTRADEAIREQQERYEKALRIERQRITDEEARRADETILRETQRIRQEQEQLYLEREQDLIRQNYHDLISAPPPTAPVAPVQETASAPAPIATEPEPTPRPAEPVSEETPSPLPKRDERLVPLPEEENRDTKEFIDFSEIRQRAALDGIRVETTGQHAKGEIAKQTSDNLVYKGKCLFLSSIVACLFCIVLGSVLLGIQQNVAIPVFYPYLIWCIGICLLLAMGLTYANHYGERAIRQNSVIVLINVAVIYALCVIVNLIIALSANIDFSNVALVASFIYIPIVFELTIPIFGTVYYFLVRAK